MCRIPTTLFLVEGTTISVQGFVLCEVLRPSQQLRSCRDSQLPANTVPGQTYTF